MKLLQHTTNARAAEALAASRNGIEIWASVPGYEGWYEASNLGKVRSVERKVQGRPGVPLITRYSKQLFGIGGDYQRVVLCKNKVRKIMGIHQIVMLTFIGPCPTGMEIRHLDDVKTNNALFNLKHGTKFDNQADRRRNGIWGKNTKLTIEQVKYIRACGKRPVDLARELNVNESTIRGAKNKQRKKWLHVN